MILHDDDRPGDTPPSPTGDQLRDRAISMLRLHRAVLVRRLQRAFLGDILDRGPTTADRLRELVEIPPSLDPRVTGAAIRTLAEAELIEGDGYVPSRRPVAHCRPVLRWRIVDPAGVTTWLATHPELPNVTGEGAAA